MRVTKAEFAVKEHWVIHRGLLKNGAIVRNWFNSFDKLEVNYVKDDLRFVIQYDHIDETYTVFADVTRGNQSRQIEWLLELIDSIRGVEC